MKGIADELPGIERIKLSFLSLLEERKSAIAHHALAAWDSADPAKVSLELEAAQNILHKISGSAGSLGFDDLGQAARDCEGEIISHLARMNYASAEVTGRIMAQLDTFVCMSQDLIAA